MSEFLPYDEIQFSRYVNFEDISNTPDDVIGCFVESDLSHPNNMKEKTKTFPFCPENKKIDPSKFNSCMNKIKPDNYTQN